MRELPEKKKLDSQFSSVTQSCLRLCDPIDGSTPGFPIPSPTPRACSNSCPSSWWCHPTISSSVVPFSCLQSFPAPRSFPVSHKHHSLSKNVLTPPLWVPISFTPTAVWGCLWRVQHSSGQKAGAPHKKLSLPEEPRGLQSTGSQRVGHDWVTSLHFTSM